MIEVLNNKTINEAGAKYKIETRKIQKELEDKHTKEKRITSIVIIDIRSC